MNCFICGRRFDQYKVKRKRVMLYECHYCKKSIELPFGEYQVPENVKQYYRENP
jgi:DNA-directed RNA polymerase subunit RPC12/RpoP